MNFGFYDTSFGIAAVCYMLVFFSFSCGHSAWYFFLCSFLFLDHKPSSLHFYPPIKNLGTQNTQQYSLSVGLDVSSLLLEECIKEKVCESSPRTHTISREKFPKLCSCQDLPNRECGETNHAEWLLVAGGSKGDALVTLVTPRGAAAFLSGGLTSSSS